MTMMLRPHLETASRQELFCVVVAGMSSLAGSSMILFSNYGVHVNTPHITEFNASYQVKVQRNGLETFSLEYRFFFEK